MGKVELKIEIDEALLEQARAIDLDVAAQAENGLRRAVLHRLAQRNEIETARAWATENADALALHAERIAEYGVFGDDLRRW